MYLLLSIFAAIAPALFLVRHYYRQDRHRPEPRNLVIGVFLLGVICTVPAIVIELTLRKFEAWFAGAPFAVALFRSFVVAALTEEWIKLQVVKRYAWKKADFDETADGVVYAVVASMGFACMENILYVAGSGLEVAVIRAFTAVPMHAFASGIMGFYIGQARFDGAREKGLIRKGLAVAVAIHGVYDLLLFVKPALAPLVGEAMATLPALGIIPLLAVSFVILRKKMRAALDDDLASGRAARVTAS